MPMIWEVFLVMLYNLACTTHKNCIGQSTPRAHHGKLNNLHLSDNNKRWVWVIYFLLCTNGFIWVDLLDIFARSNH